MTHILRHSLSRCFFFNYTPTTTIYTLSLHDALPISFPLLLLCTFLFLPLPYPFPPPLYSHTVNPFLLFPLHPPLSPPLSIALSPLRTPPTCLSPIPSSSFYTTHKTPRPSPT